MRTLPEPSGTFPEPPILSAPVFLIPIIPIRNLGSAHPQARIGLGSASDTTTSFLLAVHLTRPRIGTFGNLPSRSRTCPGVPSVTPSPTQSSNALVARGARHLLSSRTPVPSVLRTSLRAFPTLGVGSSGSRTPWSLGLALPTRLLLPSSRLLRTLSGKVWLRFHPRLVVPLGQGLGPLFLDPRGLLARS